MPEEKKIMDFFDRLRVDFDVTDFTGYLGQITQVSTDPEEDSQAVFRFLERLYNLAADYLEGKGA